MMYRYNSEKNIVILAGVMLLLLLFTGGVIHARNDIIVFRDIDDRYLLLEAGEGKLFFPLPIESRAWLGMSEWQNLSREFSKYFPFNKRWQAKVFQEDIGFERKFIDGNWGKGCWMKMASFIKKTVVFDIAHFSIGNIRFKSGNILEDLFFELPTYDETPQFFWNLNRLREKVIAKKKLEKVELPLEIEIFSFKNTSGYLNWIPELKRDFDIAFEYPGQYLSGVKIRDDEIHIARIADVYPGSVTIPLRIRHKEFPDIEKNSRIRVIFPDKPKGKVISGFVHGLASYLAIAAFLILAYLLFVNIKGRIKADKNHERMERGLLRHHSQLQDQISSLYESGNLYKGLKGDIKKSVEDILNKIRNHQNYEPEDREWGTENPEIVNSLKQLAAVKGYVVNSGVWEDHFLNFLLNVNHLLDSTQETDSPQEPDPSREIPSSAEEIRSSDKTEVIDKMYKKIEARINSDIEKVKFRDKKYANMVNHTKLLLQPFEDDEDIKHFLSEEFRDEDSDRQDEYINMLSERIRGLEIRMPLYLKMVEEQLQRAALITEKLLKPQASSLGKYNLKKDIDDLARILNKAYLGEIGDRPGWTDQSPFHASTNKGKLRDDFWLKIWYDAELGASIQYIQKILFKLKLILKDKDAIDDSIFSGAYEMAMASEAVLFILQGIALSCGRLYHVVEPGDKLNLRFASTEGDLNILRNKVYKSICERYNWQHDDIYDGSYWGLCEITKGGLKRSKESRVVVHYDKERDE